MAQRQQQQFQIQITIEFREVRSASAVVDARRACESAGDGRRRSVDDRQQRGRDIAAIFRAPEIEEGFALLIGQPERVHPRAAQPDRKDAGRLDFDNKAVRQHMPNRGGVYIASVRSRARAAQPQGGPVPNPRFAKWNLKGYQADFDYANRYSGQLYEQGTPRGIIAWRGQMVRTEQGKKPRLLGMLGDPDALKTFIKVGDWNQMYVSARGNTMIHVVNGHVMSIFIDDDPAMAVAQGVIGLQIEGSGNVKVSFRNLWLKNLP